MDAKVSVDLITLILSVVAIVGGFATIARFLWRLSADVRESAARQAADIRENAERQAADLRENAERQAADLRENAERQAADNKALADRVGALGERVARIEGLLEGLRPQVVASRGDGADAPS